MCHIGKRLERGLAMSTAKRGALFRVGECVGAKSGTAAWVAPNPAKGWEKPEGGVNSFRDRLGLIMGKVG